MEKEKNDGKQAKCLYHVYHKIGEMRRIMDIKNRGEPQVRLETDSEENRFIRRIRTGPNEGEFEIEKLKARAIEQLNKIETEWAVLDKSGFEDPIVVRKLLNEWLYTVRKYYF